MSNGCLKHSINVLFVLSLKKKKGENSEIRRIVGFFLQHKCAILPQFVFITFKYITVIITCI